MSRQPDMVECLDRAVVVGGAMARLAIMPLQTLVQYVSVFSQHGGPVLLVLFVTVVHHVPDPLNLIDETLVFPRNKRRCVGESGTTPEAVHGELPHQSCFGRKSCTERLYHRGFPHERNAIRQKSDRLTYN